MIFEDERKQLTLQEIEQAEIRIGKKFPMEYKKFLLEHNGGTPERTEFEFTDTFGEPSDSLIHYFLAIYDEEGYDNLESECDNLDDRMLPNILPIASDPFGNLICISVEGGDKGKIYFWDHELETVEASYENLSLIANSFSEFMNLLE